MKCHVSATELSVPAHLSWPWPSHHWPLPRPTDPRLRQNCCNYLIYTNPSTQHYWGILIFKLLKCTRANDSSHGRLLLAKWVVLLMLPGGGAEKTRQAKINHCQELFTKRDEWWYVRGNRACYTRNNWHWLSRAYVNNIIDSISSCILCSLSIMID